MSAEVRDISHAEAQSRGGWEERRLKSILRPHKKLLGKCCNEYDLLSLTLRGIIKRDMDNPEGKFPASFETYQEVNPGDFVFCMFDNEETPRAVGLSGLRGMITGAYDVMSLIAEGVSREFLNYYFLWVDDGKRLKPLYKGLRKTVPLDSFLAYKISLPPLPEQKAIVAYLDAETGRIDKAIAAEEKMIALLLERREIVINEAVGGGDLSHAEAQRGRVRRGWEVRRLKSLLRPHKILVGKHCNEYDLLSLTLRGIVKRDMDNPEGKFPASFETYQEVNPGEFVFCMFDNEETPRAVGLSSLRGMITGAYDVMSLIDSGISSKYLNYYFLWIDDGKRLKPLYKGLRKTVPLDSFMTYKIPLPPLPEQEAIVERLDRETGKIDRAIEVKRRQIELLRERRQIVIDEVVTGKVKVA